MKKDDEKQVKEGIKILKATAARLDEREKKLKSSPAVQLTYIKWKYDKIRNLEESMQFRQYCRRRWVGIKGIQGVGGPDDINTNKKLQKYTKEWYQNQLNRKTTPLDRKKASDKEPNAKSGVDGIRNKIKSRLNIVLGIEENEPKLRVKSEYPAQNAKLLRETSIVTPENMAFFELLLSLKTESVRSLVQSIEDQKIKIDYEKIFVDDFSELDKFEADDFDDNNIYEEFDPSGTTALFDFFQKAVIRGIRSLGDNEKLGFTKVAMESRLESLNISDEEYEFTNQPYQISKSMELIGDIYELMCDCEMLYPQSFGSYQIIYEEMEKKLEECKGQLERRKEKLDEIRCIKEGENYKLRKNIINGKERQTSETLLIFMIKSVSEVFVLYG